MRLRNVPRLHLGLGILVVFCAGGLFYYPSWRFSRDYRAAEEAMAAYDFRTARERLAWCAERRRDDPAVHLMACRAARREGDLPAAEEHYARYRRLIGTLTPDTTLERALLDAQSGQVAEVLAFLLRRLEDRDPRTEEILEALAVGSVGLYQFDRAAFWTTELLDRAPKNPIGRWTRSQTISTLGRPEESIAILREVVRDYPWETRAWLSLGELYLTTNRVQEAVDAYTEARNLVPGDVRALHGLARALCRPERLDEFRQLAPELERRSDDSEALYHCGRFAIFERRWADAEQLLGRAIQLAPNDHEVHRELAVCLQQLGRDDEARRHTERVRAIEADLAKLESLVEAVVKSPQNPAPRREAGLICLRNGQVQEGLRWLHGVLETTPNDRTTHEALADYFASQGNTERAAYHRQKAR
jgi:tetratricopeptide (TPR) repeat protein